MVRVQEVPLDNVPMLTVLLLQLLLLLVILRAAEKKGQLGDNSWNIWVSP